MDDRERRARFEREARAVAALNHPSIVTVYSVEDAGGVPFLTMELVEGRPLLEAIPTRGLPLDQLLGFAIPLASLKVLDFGLAKWCEVSEPNPDAPSLPTLSQLTGDGRILGNVAYMSPEQAEGKPIDARSDIFSLGVVLYEMATGQPPFKGETAAATLSAVLRETPLSVTELRPALPSELGRVVRR